VVEKESICFWGTPDSTYSPNSAGDQMEAFDRADASRRGGAQIAKISIPVKWQAPPEGFLKINWDASLDVSRKRMGMGIAIRDYRGKLLVAYCATREFITDPATAEALTAWQAAQLSHRLGLQNIVLEGDALEVVNVLRTEETWLGRYGHILQDAKHMLSQCREWQVNHVHRQGNAVAHGLAKLALNIQQEVVWTDNFPLCIWDLVNTEQGSH
jgi:hypothetical protein